MLVAKLATGLFAQNDQWFRGRTNNPWNLVQGASAWAPFAEGADRAREAANRALRLEYDDIEPGLHHDQNAPTA